MPPHKLDAKLDLAGRAGLQLSMPMSYRVLLRRPIVWRLDQSHVRYSNDSAFLTPGPWTEYRHPVAALAEAAVVLEQNQTRRLVLCGHASAVGSAKHNDRLSLDRVHAIVAIGSGEASRWVEIVTRSGSIRDVKAYLSYLHQRRGWQCEVGLVDENVTEDVERSIKRFQEEYNTRFSGALVPDGICGKETLGAIFDVQYFELRAWLAKFGLAPDALRLSEAFVLHAGSEFAGVADRQRQLESADRIVDILFVDVDDLGGGSCGAELLYGSVPRVEEISVGEQPGDWEYGSLLVVTDLHPKDIGLEESYRLVSDDGSYDVILTVSADGAVANGGIELEFVEVPTDKRYALIITSQEGESSVVFEDAHYAEFHGLSTSLTSELPET